jgi:hypothetical protein
MSHLYAILAWAGWIWFAVFGAILAAKLWRDQRRRATSHREEQH